VNHSVADLGRDYGVNARAPIWLGDNWRVASSIINRTPTSNVKYDQAQPRITESRLRTRMRAMTEAEIEVAAAADPDARPMTPEELRTARRVPRVKKLRRALGLTQQEFAARYHIPLGTLRDWEQGRTEPDQPARAYLTVIARDPEGARRACQGSGSRED
jgi:putative transcriptional regulator